MSESKLISPLLDGFVMGAPVSEHHGVRCCPAMKVETGEKYLVKIISVPASQTNLAALLLAGAFENRDAALAYYKELADEIVEDAKLLQRLARLEGFVAYEAWQIAPPEGDRTCYEVYLLGAYRHTLDRFFQKECMTHLRAVNLGIDLCAALSACRKNGYLYVDLKPENVILTDDGEYRINDLGFMDMASIFFAALPEKYRSAYTAPEIKDAYDALNDTVDTYAAGLILYQAYNNGILPFAGPAPAEPLDPPAYADSEMTEIILKACAPDPKDRWQDPVQMGQALVSYMQRTTVNDVPIVPIPEEPEVAEEAPEVAEPSTEQILAEVDMALEAVGVTATEELPAEEAPVEETPIEETPVEETPIEETPVEETPVEETPVEETPVEETPVEETPVEEASDTDDVAAMLAQADDLIAHELPGPVVVPDPSLVSETTVAEEEASDPEPEETEVEEPAAAPVVEAPVTEEVYPEEDPEDDYPVKKKHHKGIVWLFIVLLLIAGLLYGGNLFYKNYYIQTIDDFTLKGFENKLTVTIRSDIEDALLTVHCSDTYGSTVSQPVENGVAHFTELRPGVRYSVYVTISGFHKLEGVVEDFYTTPSITSVSNLTAITGSENGSAILNFNVQGEDSAQWTVFYQAENEAEKNVTFSGHMVTVTGLTVGSNYTFRVEPVSDLYLVGENTVSHTASNVIYAEGLMIESAQGGKLVAVWNVPEGITVESWTVHCYNGSDYNATITVTEPRAVFEDLVFAEEFTIEVTADGMTQSVRTYISPNPITIQYVDFDDSNPNQLVISWDFEGESPEHGWLVLYKTDADADTMPVKSSEAYITINPAIPGTVYTVTIQTVEGYTVFNSNHQHETPEAKTFSGYDMQAKYMQFEMCVPPTSTDWRRNDLDASAFTTQFSAGSIAAFAVTLKHEYNTSPDVIVTLFVIRDADGHIVSAKTQSKTWTSMWYKGFGRIYVPELPATAGEYTMDIYFNSQIVHSQKFSII